MAKFTKPENLNGAELRDELKRVKISISDDSSAVSIDENGELNLEISDSDIEKAALIVASHNGTIIAPEPTITQKLALVGLNLDDLKTALGL
jgi:hypothetical protein